MKAGITSDSVYKKKWSDVADAKLQDCFAITDWNMFRDSSDGIEENTTSATGFIDYTSAFNTIVPSKLITKLRILGINTSLCNWILDFLMGHPQVVL